MKHSLEVYTEDKLIFKSDRNWLHPLFELEEFLKNNQYPPETLLVKDKIVGKAAALILIYLNIGSIYAQILSEVAKDSLEHFNIPFKYEELIDRIKCKTEDLLLNEFNPSTAYEILKERAQKS